MQKNMEKKLEQEKIVIETDVENRVNLTLFYTKLREKGMSVKELALAAGISLSAMNYKLQGMRRFTLRDIDRISAVLDLTREESYLIFIDGYWQEAI